MNIKRIIKEEIEEWEWAEGDIDLKHILEILLEDTQYFIHMGNIKASIRDVNNEGHSIFIYEKGREADGHYDSFRRDQTLEDVLSVLKNFYSGYKIGEIVREEYQLLHDTIKLKSEELFGM